MPQGDRAGPDFGFFRPKKGSGLSWEIGECCLAWRSCYPRPFLPYLEPRRSVALFSLVILQVSPGTQGEAGLNGALSLTSSQAVFVPVR